MPITIFLGTRTNDSNAALSNQQRKRLKQKHKQNIKKVRVPLP